MGMAFIWTIFFETTIHLIIGPLIRNKPAWLISSAEREYYGNAKEGFEAAGLKMDRDEYVNFFISIWPYTIAMFLQHIIGGSLCIPSLWLNWTDLGNDEDNDEAIKFVSSLACLAVL